MKMTREQRESLASLLNAYRDMRDDIPEDTENDFEWHRRLRYDAMVEMAYRVLVALGIDPDGV